MPETFAPPNSDINPLATLNATAGAVKGQADPKTIVGVANAARSPGEAVTNIQAIAHSGNMVKMYDTLHGMDISHQAQAWGGLDPSEQSSLRALGYAPPNPDALTHAGAGGQHGGFWGRAMGYVGDVGHDIAHVASDVPHAASDTLNAIGSPLRAFQHLERAGNTVAEVGMHAAGQSWAEIAKKSSSGGIDPFEGWNEVLNPHAWSQAWDMTNNGNTTLDPAQNRVLVAKYGQKQVNLAIQVSNEGPDAAINSAPQSQRQALINQVQDPKFVSLVGQVGNARVSLGRMAVGSQYMNQHPLAGKVLSGSIDAATDILTDPTLKLGKVSEVTKLARFGVTDASRAEDLINGSASVQRKINQIAPYLEQGRYGELGKLDPRLEHVAGELAQNNIDSAAKLKDWLVNKNGLKAIIGGEAAKISHQAPVMPHLSYLGWMKDNVKAALSDTTDRLAYGKAPDIPLEQNDVWGAGDHSALGALDHRVNNFVSLMEKGKLAGGYGRIPGVSNVARLVRRMDTYIPTQDAISYTDKEADLTNFRRMLQGFLPAHMVDEGSNLFTVGSEAQRRQMILAGMKQQAYAAGLYNTGAGAQKMDDMFAAIADEDRSQAYGVDDYDTYLDDSRRAQHSALYETQTSGQMRIILPSVMRSLVRSESLLSVAGVHPMNVLDRGMLYWRTLILDRPGFAVRVALDENLARLLRDGPRAFFGSMVANGASRTRTDEDIESQIGRMVESGQLREGDVNATRAGLKAASYKQILPYHPIDRALQLLADRAPEGVRNNWRNVEEFYGGVMGATARKWARTAEDKVGRAFGLGEYIDGATHLAMHQNIADSALQDILAHMTGTSDGFTVTPGSLVKFLRRGIDGKPGYFKEKGFSQADLGADLGNPLYAFKWQGALDGIARSQLGQAVLHSVDMSREDQIKSVLHVLNAPDFADAKAGMDRSLRLRDGRLVGSEASQPEADRDLAESIVDNTNAHVRSGTYDPNNPGEVIRPLVDHMIKHGAGPDTDLLDSVIKSHKGALPGSVVGPDLVPVPKLEGFLSRSFEELAGKPMNWMARQPHLIHQYTAALRDARAAAEKLGLSDEQHVSDVAFQRAIQAMLPYIHNPELRTQFEDKHRVIFPFLFAQRQFLLRWARTFADSPSAVRKLQLGMNGLRSMGVVKKDQNGNDFFYYPGSQYVTEMISDTLNRIGVHSSIPFAVPFTGEVKYLMPGLANPVTPSVGPFAAVGMKALARAFPQMEGINQAVLGQGAAENDIQQFMPTIANRLVAAFAPGSAGSEKASAIAMMMKYMDANGQGLPQNATPGQVEQYIDRVDMGSTEIMAVRAVLGFGLPSTPTAGLDPQGLDARYKELLAQLPYDQALGQFYKEHPNGSAYTIGTTEGATSGNLPATQQDLAFTNAHVDFAKNYPAAFPWLAPRSPGAFSLTEFLEQETTGQRTPLPTWDPHYGAKSVLANIMNAKASNEYYKVVDQYDQAYGSTTNPALRKQYTYNYDQWKAGFEARNPTFTQYLNTQQGKNNREVTIRQVRQAVNDPQVPDSPAVPGIKAILTTYDEFKAAMGQYTGSNTTSAYDIKQAYKANAVAWGTQYVKAHPAVADFWNTIVRPTIDEAT